MNRLDRLFGLLLELQDGRVHTAAQLADRFGVTARTVYRDAATLVGEGIPLRAEAGVGYQLQPGFFLSPLDFTPDEAVVLRLGLSWMAANTGGRWAHSTRSALAKVSASLGPRARAEVERFTTLITLCFGKGNLNLDDPRVRLCLKAVSERKTLRLSYTSFKDKVPTERIVEPWGLSYSAGKWYLDGWCRLRDQSRSFRFDRIDDLGWDGQRFEPRPATPSAKRAWLVAVEVPEAQRRWVDERQHWGWISDEEREDGVLARYAVDNLDEFLPWILSWGPRVRLREPAELVEMVRTSIDELRTLLT